MLQKGRYSIENNLDVGVMFKDYAENETSRFRKRWVLCSSVPILEREKVKRFQQSPFGFISESLSDHLCFVCRSEYHNR